VASRLIELIKEPTSNYQGANAMEGKTKKALSARKKPRPATTAKIPTEWGMIEADLFQLKKLVREYGPTAISTVASNVDYYLKAVSKKKAAM
jgi:hypothetical protein